MKWQWPWVSRKKAEAERRRQLTELRRDMGNHEIRMLADERATYKNLGQAIAEFRVQGVRYNEDRKFYRIVASVDLDVLIHSMKFAPQDYLRVLLENNFARLLEKILADANSIAAEQNWKED
jgi:hypothetical protein